MKFLCSLLIFVSIPVLASECKIGGEPIWWAYDFCLVEFETDDTLHPDVIECVDSLESELKSTEDCEFKLKIKSRLCRFYGENEPTYKHCMNHNISLGPTVKNKGV